MDQRRGAARAVEHVVRRLLEGEQIQLEELDGMQAGLREVLESPQIRPDDPRTTTLFDLLRAMSLLDEDDPALAWNRGGLLGDWARHVEAADANLDAFSRSNRSAQAGDGSDEEEDWAQAALYHAARYLLLAGQTVSAGILYQRLTDEDYSREIRGLLEQAIGGERPDPVRPVDPS